MVTKKFFALLVTCGAVFGTTAVAHAGDSGAWWQPVGFSGHVVSAVHASGKTVSVTVDGEQWVSTDGAVTFVSGGVAPPESMNSHDEIWTIADGRVVHGQTLDPSSPPLGSSAHLIAAPTALPGTVVAVSDDGVVWRRSSDGKWQQSFVLLPQRIGSGPPTITALAAFDQPITGAVYLATDGYSVLETSNGGDDWVRAGPGLPDAVLSLATDSTTHTIYAGTRNGLWVHVVRAIPTPPIYTDNALWWRRGGIAVVVLLAAAMTLGLLSVAIGSSSYQSHERRNDC